MVSGTQNVFIFLSINDIDMFQVTQDDLRNNTVSDKTIIEFVQFYRTLPESDDTVIFIKSVIDEFKNIVQRIKPLKTNTTTPTKYNTPIAMTAGGCKQCKQCGGNTIETTAKTLVTEILSQVYDNVGGDVVINMDLVGSQESFDGTEMKQHASPMDTSRSRPVSISSLDRSKHFISFIHVVTESGQVHKIVAKTYPKVHKVRDQYDQEHDVYALRMKNATGFIGYIEENYPYGKYVVEFNYENDLVEINFGSFVRNNAKGVGAPGNSMYRIRTRNKTILTYRTMITENNMHLGYISLADYLKQTPVNDADVIERYRAIIRTHHGAFVSHGFVHGDLHPGNVYVHTTKTADVKLFDFDFSTFVTKDGVTMMSPWGQKEKIKIDGHVYDYHLKQDLAGKYGFLFDFARLLYSLMMTRVVDNGVIFDMLSDNIPDQADYLMDLFECIIMNMLKYKDTNGFNENEYFDKWIAKNNVDILYDVVLNILKPKQIGNGNKSIQLDQRDKKAIRANGQRFIHDYLKNMTPSEIIELYRVSEKLFVV